MVSFLRKLQKLWRNLLWIFITLAIFTGGDLKAAQEQRYIIDIYKEQPQKISIAVVGFQPFRLMPTSGDLAKTAAAVLDADLKNSSIFDVLDPSFLPFEPSKIAIGEEKGVLPILNALKVQALVVADLSARGKDVVLEGRLFDIAQGEMVFGKRYTGDPKVLRKIVHRFADEITYRLTGEKGIAQSKIAFVSVVNGAKEIFVMDYDGHNPILVTGNRSINLSPRLSPDGRFLAYTSYLDKNPDLFILDLETGRRQKISAAPGLNISPAWSPDGQWIALALSRDGGTNLYLLHRDGSKLRQLTSGSGINVSPTFSPNGRQIAFVSDRGGSPQIYMMDVEGTNTRRLTFTGNYNASPRWSPKGDKIAFISRHGEVFNIYLMNPDGSEMKQLTSNAGNNEDPAWSPNGRHIVFTSNRDGKRTLYIMNADGSNQRRLIDNGRENYLPEWSP